MAGVFDRVTTGQPLAGIRAEAWNAMLAAAEAHQGGRRDQPAKPGQQWGTVEALALNSTGADLREYKPATVTAAGGYDLTADTPAADWNRRPLLTLGVPTAATDYVVVTLEAIPAESIGRVAVSGVCLCDVSVNSSGHAFASPTTNTTALESAATGSIRLLHKGTGSSTRRCAVYLGDQLPDSDTPLNTQNTDGTEVDATTTDLRANKGTGVKFTQSGGTTTLTGVDAAYSQTGVVNTATEQILDGTKIIRGQRHLTSPNVLGIYLSVGASDATRTDGQVDDYGGLGATGVGGLITLGNGSNNGTMIGIGVNLTGSYPHAVSWIHPGMQDADGVYRMVWGVGNPYTSFGGYNAIPAGFAVWTGAGQKVGIDRTFAAGEAPIVSGGIVVGKSTVGTAPTGAAGGDLAGTYPNPTLANDAVTNAKAANMAQSTIKGRAVGAGTGDPTDLTGTQATAILDTFVGSGASHAKGLVSDPPATAGTSLFLREDATWALPAPVGTVAMWVTATPPTDWLICDGSTFSSATYPALNTLLGGTTLPDMRGRSPMGAGTGSGLTARTLGTNYGAETHSLSAAENGPHTHDSYYASVNIQAGATPINQVVGPPTTPISTSSAGSGSAHANVHPVLAVNFIIKAK